MYIILSNTNVQYLRLYMSSIIMSSEIDHTDTISYKIISKGQTITVIVQDFLLSITYPESDRTACIVCNIVEGAHFHGNIILNYIYRSERSVIMKVHQISWTFEKLWILNSFIFNIIKKITPLKNFSSRSTMPRLYRVHGTKNINLSLV